jgi:hypothetical protein
LSADGKRVLIGLRDGSEAARQGATALLRLHDTRTGKEVRRFAGHKCYVD